VEEAIKVALVIIQFLHLEEILALDQQDKTALAQIVAMMILLLEERYLMVITIVAIVKQEELLVKRKRQNPPMKAPLLVKHGIAVVITK
jgi:hypothetical protein